MRKQPRPTPDVRVTAHDGDVCVFHFHTRRSRAWLKNQGFRASWLKLERFKVFIGESYARALIQELLDRNMGLDLPESLGYPALADQIRRSYQ